MYTFEVLANLVSGGGDSTVALVGNHDRSNDASVEAHAMQAHYAQCYVVSEPRVRDGILYLPFYFKAEDFVEVCNRPEHRDIPTVVCHQSFIGAKFETGLTIDAAFDKAAVDLAAIPQKRVISGHIHTPQHAGGKLWYVGSPRWRNNVSDANIERFIYAVDFEGGLPKAVRKYETGLACRRIWKWKLNEVAGSDIEVKPSAIKPEDRLVVDLEGTSAWVESMKDIWQRRGARIRATLTDRAAPKLSEAEGVESAWAKWTKAYQPKYGTPVEELEKTFRERIA